MLNPEEAKKRLKEFRASGGRAERIQQLPPELRTVGFGLLQKGPEGERIRPSDAEEAARSEAVLKLEALPVEERALIWAALFPRLGPHVEGTWQMLAHRPYEGGGERRAFRAPGDLAALRPSRTAWLVQMLEFTKRYEQDAAWFAVWTPYLEHYWTHQMGILLAAALDGGGPEGEAVWEVLQACVHGEHPIGAMGRHVTTALLAASRPEGWELVEKLLLAAQRQEGLRQTILESVDESHPEAFRRMLRLILEHDLLRFSATVRAVDVWFGFEYEAADGKGLKGTVEQALSFLEDAAARDAALLGDDPHALYLALWAVAFEDARAAVPHAARRLDDPSVECRFASVCLLEELHLAESKRTLLAALEDPDLRVALRAAGAVIPSYYYGAPTLDVSDTDLFERLEQLLERLPKKPGSQPPLVWPWAEVITNRENVARGLLSCLGDRSPKRLIPHLSKMDTYARSEAAAKLSKLKADPDVRETLFALAGDTSEYVRGQAQEILRKMTPEEPEAIRLERLLTRKAGDLRRGVLSLLLNQPDSRTLASADRLTAASDALQRQAGLELLQQMVHAERAVDDCRERAARYRTARPTRSETENQLLAQVEALEEAVPTLDDALGLLDPDGRTPGVEPREIPGTILVSDAAKAIVTGLCELIGRHKETPVTLQNWDGSEREELLGNVHYGFPHPRPEVALEADAVRLPLREVWEQWWDGRPAAMRDPDGMELLRASVGQSRSGWGSQKFGAVVPGLLDWLLRLRPPQGDVVGFLLDAAETSVAQIPQEIREKVPPPERTWDEGWRASEKRMVWVEQAREHRALCPEAWRPEHHARFWRMLRWLDEPGLPLPRFRPRLDDVLAAYACGAATEADLIDHLLGARRDTGGGYYVGRTLFNDLHRLSGRKEDPRCARLPGLQAVVERCRKRVVEVEVRRGDLPTAASHPALALRYAGGTDTLIAVLQSLGKASLVRTGSYGDPTKAAVLSHLLRITFPGEGETPERFAEAVRAAGIAPDRLIDTAFYAPQWAAHVERALDWPLFAEAVWWIHAHTKDTQWSVEDEVKQEWIAQISERTPLSAQSLIDGAVDVAWFARIQAAIGPERWKRLDAGAKYASGGGGHKRAQLFADAMLGRLDPASLVAQIEGKRSQDALRALGLVPLPAGDARGPEVLRRYRLLQEFLRGSRQFGSQKQASEKLAVSIAMENLARTAGYPDPVRLEWAMEAREIEDLASGPLVASAGEVQVSLSLNSWGEPDLAVLKNGKPLKAIPPAAKKDPAVSALVERKRQVEQQASRMRRSLEEAMCRGDRFTGGEVRDLCRHPVLAPMLRNLVFVRVGAEEVPESGAPIGYPAEEGLFEAHDGALAAIEAHDTLRLAHPYDLYRSGEWHQWQRDCFRRERLQPFKQVFRELYVLTQAEREDGSRSRRYAGHQVNGGQALALLGKRGWIANRDEGDVRRTFHQEGVTAWIEFNLGITTPAEVEGLTLESVGFSRRGEWQTLPLTEIPPRLFSEVMRDVDLVVSVAHAGVVDPEATASTVEMRASLVRETAELLRLDNLRFQGSHVLIDGKLGTYSIHLGSAVVHRQPGGHLCIVPVHSQHRGRLFLPFADDDPRTAEVVSKVLLLSRDSEIQDPTILEQILVG